MIIVLGGDWVRNVMKWMKLNNELSMWCHILRHRMANAQCSYHMILIVSLSYILVSFICILACWLIPKESDMKKEKNNFNEAKYLFATQTWYLSLYSSQWQHEQEADCVTPNTARLLNSHRCSSTFSNLTSDRWE